MGGPAGAQVPPRPAASLHSRAAGPEHLRGALQRAPELEPLEVITRKLTESAVANGSYSIPLSEQRVIKIYMKK